MLPHRECLDEQMRRMMSALLRTGVLLAAAVVLAGGVYYLARHGSEPPAWQVFRGEAADLCSLSGVLRDVLALRARGLIQAGLLLLILTPVARVILALVEFVREHDATFVGVTLTVLVVLLYNLLRPGA